MQVTMGIPIPCLLTIIANTECVLRELGLNLKHILLCFSNKQYFVQISRLENDSQWRNGIGLLTGNNLG